MIYEFSQAAVVAEGTLRQKPEYHPNAREPSEIVYYNKMTHDTLETTARFFGADEVERSGSLFVHIKAIKYLSQDFSVRSLSYPPLCLSDREVDCLKLRIPQVEID